MYDIYFNNFFKGLNFNDALFSLEHDYGKKVMVLNEDQKINDFHVNPVLQCAVAEGVNGNTYFIIIARNQTVCRSELRYW